MLKATVSEYTLKHIVYCQFKKSMYGTCPGC